MATRTFTTPVVRPLSWWRVDTAAGSNTPAAITPPNGGAPIQGALRSDQAGHLNAPVFRGPDGVTVLYLKRLTREVAGTVVAGSTITLDTGAADVVASPPSFGGAVNQAQVDSSISAALTGLPGTYVQVAGDLGGTPAAPTVPGLSLKAPLTQVITDVAAVASASGALVVGKHNPIDATSAARTMTLADATAAGQHVIVEKTDATTNTVTISGNIRGSAGTVVLVWQREAVELLSKADGSWWPIAGHKTKAALDAAYASIAAAGPAVGSDAWLKLHAGGNLDALITGAITRDSNGAATAAGVIWPDGTSGAYASTTVSTAFPGAVDAYTVTYIGSTTKTVTQSAITRDSTTGAVTTRPAMTVA